MKKEGLRRKTTLEKKKESRLGLPGLPGSWVDPPSQPGFYTGRSFALPEPVQPPGPRSTNQVNPSLLTMVTMISIPKQTIHNLYFFPLISLINYAQNGRKSQSIRIIELWYL